MTEKITLAEARRRERAKHETAKRSAGRANGSANPVDQPANPEAIAKQKFDAEIVKAAACIDEAAKAKREPVDEATAQAEIKRLAELKDLPYGLERKASAAKLGLAAGHVDKLVRIERESVSAKSGGGLADTEPWPDQVDGIELLDDIAAAIKRHVSVPTRGEQAIGLWIVHTHALPAATNTPRLAIKSPLPECGKSTLLDIVSGMVPRLLAASNISPAATFRAVELLRPTLIIDEADTFLPNNDELRSVLNSGHSRAQAFVWRAVQVGDDYQPRKFSTWAACAIALIGTLPATLASRSIPIALKRLTRGQHVERYMSERRPYADLGRKAARWAADNLEWLSTAEPEVPDGLANRSADNWRALFAIADRAGGAWPSFAREAALTLTNTVDSQTLASLLLVDIRTALGSLDRISSKELVARLLEMEGQPWPEMPRGGKPITQNGVARLLKPFAVFPRTVRIDGVETSKGYMANDLQEAFERYLPPAEASSPTT